MRVIRLGVAGFLASSLALSAAPASASPQRGEDTFAGSAVVFGSFFDVEGERLAPEAPVEFQSGVIDVAAGHGFALALKESGEVVAWPPGSRATQVPAEALYGVTSIAASQSTAYAIKNGQLIVWGNHKLEAPPLTGVVDVAAGWDLAVARRADGSVVSWNPIEWVGSKRYWRTVPAEVRDVDSISVGLYAVALKDGVPLPWLGKYLLPVPEAFRSGVTAAIATSTGVAVIKDDQVFEWSYKSEWNMEAPNLIVSDEVRAWATTDRLDRLWIADAALIGLGPSGQVETLRDGRNQYRIEANPLLWSDVQDLSIDPSSGTGIAIRRMEAPDPMPRITMACKPIQVGKTRKLECSGQTTGIAAGQRLGLSRNVWKDGEWMLHPQGPLWFVPGIMPAVKPDGTFRFRVSNPLHRPIGWIDGTNLATRNAYRVHYHHVTKHRELVFQSNHADWLWSLRK